MVVFPGCKNQKQPRITRMNANQKNKFNGFLSLNRLRCRAVDLLPLALPFYSFAPFAYFAVHAFAFP
jgi:hypothetical protein